MQEEAAETRGLRVLSKQPEASFIASLFSQVNSELPAAFSGENNAAAINAYPPLPSSPTDSTTVEATKIKQEEPDGDDYAHCMKRIKLDKNDSKKKKINAAKPKRELRPWRLSEPFAVSVYSYAE